MSQLLPLFVSAFVFVSVFVFVFVSVFEFSSKFGWLTSWAFRKYTIWGVPEAWRQYFRSSVNSGKISAGGRTGIEGSISSSSRTWKPPCIKYRPVGTKSHFYLMIALGGLPLSLWTTSPPLSASHLAAGSNEWGAGGSEEQRNRPPLWTCNNHLHTFTPQCD